MWIGRDNLGGRVVRRNPGPGHAAADSNRGAKILDGQPYTQRGPWGGSHAAPIFLTTLGITMIEQGLDVKKSRRKRADTSRPLDPRPIETAGTAASVQGAAPRTVIDEEEAL